MRCCYLVGAAPKAWRIDPRPGDFVIAADGGCDHLRRWGVTPDLIVGDMDSITGALPQGVPCVKVPAEKDDTDLVLAFEEGHRRGHRRFVLTGASSSERMDHTMANLQLLVRAARRGAFAVMRDASYSAAAIAGPGELHLRGSGTVSVFAYGEQAAGVTIEGMKYNIADETLRGDTPLGVSNELAGNGRVAVEHGVLLVYAMDGVMIL